MVVRRCPDSRRCPEGVQRLSEVVIGCPKVVRGCRRLSEAVWDIPKVSQRLSEAVRSCQTPPNTLWTASGQRLTASDSVVSYDHQFLKFNWTNILFDASLQRNWDTWWDTSGIPLGYFWIAFHWQGSSSWAKLGYLWDTSGIPVTASDSFRQLPKASDSIPLATSDSLWTTPGQPKSINF